MSLSDKTIQELVADNHYLAEALHFLGIHFYDYSEQTLEDICQEKGLNLDFVLKYISDSLENRSISAISFEALPLELLVEYLKHNHYIFIKKRLPYIYELVKKLPEDNEELKEELKFVLPLFVEDFIHHVYEEEDTLFSYILLMLKALKDQAALNKVQARMMENSIKQYQTEHEVHEDQLKGLRRMTNNFEIMPHYDLNTKVVISGLKKLDEELRYHAKVENNILFPRALELERKVLAMLRSRIALN